MAWRRGINVSNASTRVKFENKYGGAWFYLDDVQELVAVDAAVSVHVVEFEVPAKLVLHLSPHHQTQGRHVLHEVYVSILQNGSLDYNP